MLQRGKRIHLFQMVCFEIAFCMLFSAVGLVVVKSLRDHRSVDGLLGKRASAVAENVDGDEDAASGADMSESVGGSDVEAEDVDGNTAEIGAADVSGEAASEETAQSGVQDQYACTGKVTGITEDGALRTDISPTILMLHGMDQDDLVSVSVGGREYILPVEIDEALPPFWGRTRLACDAGSNTMMVARSYQDFAMMEGYTDREIGGKVSIRLLQSDAYQMRDRVKPEQVSARAASNFRNVQTGDLGKGILYRGHSPIFPEYDTVRCKNSDDFAWENQIHSVLNLNQNVSDVADAVHEECPESYYRYLFDCGNVSAVELDGEHTSDAAFGVGIAAHLRFLLNHDGPYMVHCRMGKDRAGFAVALLQALEGSTYEEIGEEYAKSFRNYYGIREGSWMDRYNETDGANAFLAMMQQGGTEQYLEDDGTLTRKAARGYMEKIGLSGEEIDALQVKLAKDVVVDKVAKK